MQNLENTTTKNRWKTVSVLHKTKSPVFQDPTIRTAIVSPLSSPTPRACHWGPHSRAQLPAPPSAGAGTSPSHQGDWDLSKSPALGGSQHRKTMRGSGSPRRTNVGPGRAKSVPMEGHGHISWRGACGPGKCHQNSVCVGGGDRQQGGSVPGNTGGEQGARGPQSVPEWQVDRRLTLSGRPQIQERP